MHNPRHEGRSPCGERGLKLNSIRKQQADYLSLPMRGAWIEIKVKIAEAMIPAGSLPMRGAWIEIS